ncbi:pantothenate kinase [Paenibacillus sp. yr247]|uniref:type II pantothenate kinase n=1 Tax=Paenibacillus sp. yr247 TaxID=1761880 RepID=UPI000887CAB1|nr:type II pantothenate kinase [Paenibacillus sp. yr247]SDN69988.1 pantothenate kinase [Paenibacillus sp. yr247]
MFIGIDAGGTLIKVVCMENKSLSFSKFPVTQIEQVVSKINKLEGAKICLTGGKAALFESFMIRKPLHIVEFEATIRGVQYLLHKSDPKQQEYVLTNVGTGTSIHHVGSSKHERIGGTGVGGGTLLGLSRLLTGITDYESIVKLAAKGVRDRIDLKVKHIYEGAEPPIPGDLTASNFGRVLHFDSKDEVPHEELLASVIGLVGETVATTSVLAAKSCGVPSVVFIGSSFIQNNLLIETVKSYTILRGAFPIFVENGEFSGAIGALFSNNLIFTKNSS